MAATGKHGWHIYFVSSALSAALGAGGMDEGAGRGETDERDVEIESDFHPRGLTQQRTTEPDLSLLYATFFIYLLKRRNSWNNAERRYTYR